MNWAKQRVLVTGGAGFLGSSLCRVLAGLGARVIALDSFAEAGGAHADNLAGCDAELILCDLTTDALEAHVSQQDVVFNLAAQTGHLRAQRRPVEDLQINALAQLRLIDAVRRTAPSARIVHASTRQVYGRTAVQPVPETEPPRCPDANSIAKLAGEQYWMMEHRVQGLQVTSLRLTNCYGPRQRVTDAEQSFLGSWIGSALRSRPMEVWGGAQVRDFCYVDDAVQAFVRAAETSGCTGQVLNVGGGATLDLRTLAEHIETLTGIGFAVRDMPPEQAAIDMGSFVADDAKFRALTGWSPRVDIQTGLALTFEWFRQRASAYLA